MELIRRAYEALGITPTRYRLSLPGPGGKYVAAPEKWQRSTALMDRLSNLFGGRMSFAGGTAIAESQQILRRMGFA